MAESELSIPRDSDDNCLRRQRAQLDIHIRIGTYFTPMIWIRRSCVSAVLKNGRGPWTPQRAEAPGWRDKQDTTHGHLPSTPNAKLFRSHRLKPLLLIVDRDPEGAWLLCNSTNPSHNEGARVAQKLRAWTYSKDWPCHWLAGSPDWVAVFWFEKLGHRISSSPWIVGGWR